MRSVVHLKRIQYYYSCRTWICMENYWQNIFITEYCIIFICVENYETFEVVRSLSSPIHSRRYIQEALFFRNDPFFLQTLLWKLYKWN